MTHYNGGIGPSEASVLKSVRYVAIVAIGGMANLWGALLLGVVLNFFSLRGAFGSYDDAVFGIILITIMMFAPQGLLRTALAREIRSFAGRFLARGDRE
jgi:branched-chain amino acid transport system permease protein